MLPSWVKDRLAVQVLAQEHQLYAWGPGFCPIGSEKGPESRFWPKNYSYRVGVEDSAQVGLKQDQG